MNGTIFQAFEWYLKADGNHWNHLKAEAQNLANNGFTCLWLPPAYKGAAGKNDVGYGVYDLYDLGEFNQKGTISTKYGTVEQYKSLIEQIHKAGMQAMGDIVLNHKLGADEKEIATVSGRRWDNREAGYGDRRTTEIYTKFNFEGRGNKYSDFKWNKNHFDGVDWDASRNCKEILQIEGKHWESDVDKENGNYDYLMGADLDIENPEVVAELVKWGNWVIKETGIDSLRLDAVKHIGFSFYKEWIREMRKKNQKELFAVGEYWWPTQDKLKEYIHKTEGEISLFDVPLHFNFYSASRSGGKYDMRHIFDGSLLSSDPMHTVTFVDNHDTQIGQSLVSWVEPWFKPLAYALILLREAGYPCVFYGDYYGIPEKNVPAIGEKLNTMIYLRKTLAYGEQHDYFDNENTIGWTREGTQDVENSGMAVIMSDGPQNKKKMYVGKQHSGERFIDKIGEEQPVYIDETGHGVFGVYGGSVSVYIKDKQ